jgi:DNA repair protein RadC
MAGSIAFPLDRLIHEGVEALSAEELIALVLQEGGRGKSGLAAALRLAREFGSVSMLARATPDELVGSSGISLEQGAALVSSFRLARLAARESAPLRLRRASDIAAIAVAEIGDASRERAIVLVCDSANRLQRILRVSEGSVDRAFLSTREILNAVLRHNGRAFAVAHNHPSGDPTPGPDDLRATAELREAARLVGLRFLDHVVIGHDRWCALTSHPEARH